MILAVVLITLIVLLLALVLFFMFAILLPAMKVQSFSVDNPVFSEIELKYVIPDVKQHKDITKHAVVLCSPDKEFASPRLMFNPAQSCRLVYEVYGSLNDCRYSCIGLGDCVKVCPQEAIIIKNRTAVVTNVCCGCGMCVDSCPKHIIKLISPEVSECKICNNENLHLTSCSAHKSEHAIEIPVKKDFKLWKSCYRIYNRGNFKK